jgi:hypothetical protein
MYSVIHDEFQQYEDGFDDSVFDGPEITGIEEKKMYATDYDDDHLKADLVSIASTSMNRGFIPKSTRRTSNIKFQSPTRAKRINRNSSTHMMSETKVNFEWNSMLYDLLYDVELNKDSSEMYIRENNRSHMK